MATVAMIAKELDHIAGWAAKQVEFGISKGDVATSQFETVQAKLAQLKAVRYEDAATLIDAIKKVAKTIGWSSDHKMKLMLTINNRLKPDASIDGATQTRKTQECNTFELYLTASEVSYVIVICRPANADRNHICVARALLTCKCDRAALSCLVWFASLSCLVLSCHSWGCTVSISTYER